MNKKIAAFIFPIAACCAINAMQESDNVEKGLHTKLLEHAIKVQKDIKTQQEKININKIFAEEEFDEKCWNWYDGIRFHYHYGTCEALIKTFPILKQKLIYLSLLEKNNQEIVDTFISYANTNFTPEITTDNTTNNTTKKFLHLKYLCMKSNSSASDCEQLFNETKKLTLDPMIQIVHDHFQPAGQQKVETSRQ